MREMNKLTKKYLNTLPYRAWDNDKRVYDSLLILHSGEKHDSGWAMINIIGVINAVPVEICACPDDISYNGFGEGGVRSDMLLKSGALHLWSSKHKFRVGVALSSTDIFAERTM